VRLLRLSGRMVNLFEEQFKVVNLLRLSGRMVNLFEEQCNWVRFMKGDRSTLELVLSLSILSGFLLKVSLYSKKWWY
jgi:hypothetical protein